jgi:diacylglycerol kinase family enzyme
MTPRLAAIVSLALLVAATVLAVVLVVGDFGKGLPVVACVVAAAIVGWASLLRRGWLRTLGLGVAVALLAGAVVLIVVNGRIVESLALLACAALAAGAARAAFAIHVTLPQSRPPERAVLFWNPRSGGGKATRFNLPDEARARGIEPIELAPGDDLETLVHDAVAHGADALAAAGGDGTQAIVARLAAEHGLPYACIPAGTRNHFALDLGVDRDDVVGALDAFVDGGERRVDLADVNGRVFVNNVSLGLYADAVQRQGYREAKLRTIIETIPDELGRDAAGNLDLHWTDPSGHDESSAPAILVSNNAYRLGRAIGSGTRPHIDEGVLGVAVFDAPGSHVRHPWHEWTAARFQVESGHPVNAGVDGEAAVLAPPLRFTSHPGALRVRIARQHPGASPSAGMPNGATGTVRALAGIAFGQDGSTTKGGSDGPR